MPDTRNGCVQLLASFDTHRARARDFRKLQFAGEFCHQYARARSLRIPPKVLAQHATACLERGPWLPAWWLTAGAVRAQGWRICRDTHEAPDGVAGAAEFLESLKRGGT